MRRHDDQAATVRLADAEREVEISRQRLRDTHEQVIEPLRGYAERNNFAQMLRDSLVQGHRKGAQG